MTISIRARPTAGGFKLPSGAALITTSATTTGELLADQTAIAAASSTAGTVSGGQPRTASLRSARRAG